MSNQSSLNAQQLSGEGDAKTTATTKDKTPSKLELDTRLDPRIKKYFAGMPLGAEKPNVSSREELLAQENSPSGIQQVFDECNGGPREIVETVHQAVTTYSNGLPATDDRTLLAISVL
jgi:hypothetical protein